MNTRQPQGDGKPEQSNSDEETRARDAKRTAAKFAALWANALGVAPPVPVDPDELNTPTMRAYEKEIVRAVRKRKREPLTVFRVFPHAARTGVDTTAVPTGADMHPLPHEQGTYRITRDAGQLVLHIDLTDAPGEQLLFFRLSAPRSEPAAVAVTLAEGVIGLPVPGTYRAPLDAFLTDAGQTMLGSVSGLTEVIDLAPLDSVTAADEALLVASEDPQPPFGRAALAAARARLRPDGPALQLALPTPTRGTDFLAAVADANTGLWASVRAVPRADLPRAASPLRAWHTDVDRARDSWLGAYRTDDGSPDLRFAHQLEATVGAVCAAGAPAEPAAEALRRAWEQEIALPLVPAPVPASPWGPESRAEAVRFVALSLRDELPAPVARFEVTVIFDRSLQGQALKLVFEEFAGRGAPVLFPDLAVPGLWVADAAFRTALADAWAFTAHQFAAGARVRWRVALDDGTAFAAPAVFEGASAGGAAAVGLLALATRQPPEDRDARVAVAACVTPDGLLGPVDEGGLRNKLRAARGAALRVVVVAAGQRPVGAVEEPLRLAATVAAALEHLLPQPQYPVLSLEQLPPPVDPNLFFGRDGTLDALDRAWQNRETTIVQITAPGGVGKSTVIWKWVRERLPQRHRYRLCPQVFEWSFYSQEQHDYQPNSGRFLRAALQHFAKCDPAGDWDSATGADEAAKGERVAEAFMRCGGVMVLDGMEPLQLLPARGYRSGLVEDAGLRAFLQHLRRHARLGPRDRRRLLVLTTRWRAADLDELDRPDSGCTTVELGTLAPADGARVLRGFHLRTGPGARLRFGDGTEEALRSPAATRALEQMSHDVGGQALALVLLGSLLVQNHGGNVEEYPTVRPELFSELETVTPGEGRDVPDEHRYARRVIRLYLHALDRDSSPRAAACRRALSQLGLFDRPIRKAKLKLLGAGPPIPGITDLPPGETLEGAMRHLEDLRVLTIDPDPNGTVNAHPLLREYLGRALRRENPDGWRAAHSRLYDGITGTERPRNAHDLEPWLEKMSHGCLAGRYHEALEDVLVRHILGGDRTAAVPIRGAYGPLLSVLSHYFVPGRDWAFVPELTDLRDRIRILKTTGECLSPTHGYAAPATLACYRHGIELTRPHPELWRLEHMFRAGYCRGLLAKGDCPEMVRACREVYNLARTSGERLFVVAGAQRLALACVHAGQFAEASALTEATLGDPLSDAEVEVATRQFLVEPVACLLLWKGFADWHLGRPGAGLRAVGEAVARARKINPHTLVVASCFAAHVHRFHDDPEGTLAYTTELLTATREHGYYFWAASGHILRGWALARTGAPDEGLALLDRGIESWNSGSCESGMTEWFATRAEILHLLGRTAEAANHLRDAEADAVSRGELYWLPEIKRLKVAFGANPLGRSGDEEEHALEDAVATAEATGSRMLRVRALRDLLSRVRARRPCDTERVLAIRARLAAALNEIDDPAGCTFVAQARALLGN
jgi:hypothetical protein